MSDTVIYQETAGELSSTHPMKTAAAGEKAPDVSEFSCLWPVAWAWCVIALIYFLKSSHFASRPLFCLEEQTSHNQLVNISHTAQINGTILSLPMCVITPINPYATLQYERLSST